jgi:hypothetical protein
MISGEQTQKPRPPYNVIIAFLYVAMVITTIVLIGFALTHSWAWWKILLAFIMWLVAMVKMEKYFGIS